MAEHEKPKHIRCSSIIEVLGKPKEHVEKTIKAYVEKIKQEDGFMVLKETFSDSKEQGKLWSIFAELDMVIEGIPKLVSFCFDYMPSSVEIIKPEELTLKNTELSGFTSDLQAKLHNVDMVVKELRAENDFLRKNMKTSLKNLIAILLKIKHMDEYELSEFSGVPKEELKILLDGLVKDEKVKKEEGVYKLVIKNEPQAQG